MKTFVIVCCAALFLICNLPEIQCTAKGHMVAISSSAAHAYYTRRRPSPAPRKWKREVFSLHEFPKLPIEESSSYTQRSRQLRNWFIDENLSVLKKHHATPHPYHIRRRPSPTPRQRKREVTRSLIWTEQSLSYTQHSQKHEKFYDEEQLSGSRSSWFSSKSSKKTSNAQPAPKQPVPSAPHHEPTIKKETSHVQQSSNAKPPAPAPGWNVGNNQNNGWKGGQQSPGVPHQQSSHYPTGNQPQSPWGASGHGYNPNPHGYSGYPQQHSGYGGHPQQGYNPHYGGMAGYGGYGGGGMGGYHGMGGQPSMGGYGAMGGYGGMGHGGWGHGGWGSGGMGGFGGTGGYGMAKSKSFFSARTIGNVMAGMLLYHVTSKVVGNLFGTNSQNRPVNVYNYYNQPETAKQEEIKLPSNILTLCEGSTTALCTSGTTAICTTNNTVLCVATMTQTAPCAQENALCVNTTVPCVDPDNPLCQNITSDKKEATVNLPCFTNLTVDVNLLNETGNAQNYQYCVTTMAVAGPEYKNCTDTDKINDFRSVLEGNYIWNLTVMPLSRPYNIYNFNHPTDAATGEIVLPVDVLIPCAENATKLCLPGVTPICTTFNEIMCLETLSASEFCEPYNTTCIKRKVPCLEKDPLCQNKTEEELIVEDEKTLVSVDLPCFANITVNANFPNFDIYSFNGTFPVGAQSSFMYHYRYCVVTLAMPGAESEICVAGPPTAAKN